MLLYLVFLKHLYLYQLRMCTCTIACIQYTGWDGLCWSDCGAASEIQCHSDNGGVPGGHSGVSCRY